MGMQLWDVRLYGVKQGQALRFDMLAEAAGQREAEDLVIVHYQRLGWHVQAVSSVVVEDMELDFDGQPERTPLPVLTTGGAA